VHVFNVTDLICCVCCLSGTPILTGTATITVNIVDANDNGPVIKYLPSFPAPLVRAATTQGDRVFCFTAEQPSMPPNAQYSFRYVCNDARCNDFTLQQTGGGRYMLRDALVDAFYIYALV